VSPAYPTRRARHEVAHLRTGVTGKATPTIAPTATIAPSPDRLWQPMVRCAKESPSTTRIRRTDLSMGSGVMIVDRLALNCAARARSVSTWRAARAALPSGNQPHVPTQRSSSVGNFRLSSQIPDQDVAPKERSPPMKPVREDCHFGPSPVSHTRDSGEQATAAALTNTIIRRAATPAPATSPAKCRNSG
jgi:hypothetical protein